MRLPALLRRRVVPPPEPEPPPGRPATWQPEPGCRYLTAKDLPVPRHPDVTVFGDWHPPPE